MRRLEPKEIERRLAARRRADEMAQAQERKPTSPERQQAIGRAGAALNFVISDVESTTPVRERSAILRYDDWIFEDAQDPVHGSSTEGMPRAMGTAMKMTRLSVAGHTFALDDDQSIADIAYQVQDDVTDEIWGAWPACPAPQHPMSPGIVAETATWTCPADADIAVPIGQLGHGPVSPPSLPSSSPPG